MRVAVVGLGKIAQKAYLPVITARQDLDLIFCTRDRGALDRLSETYRVKECVSEVADLAGRKVDAAFVHTSTESHLEVAGRLLRSGVHVYVDKPIAYSFEQSQELVELAEREGRILMVGFNRRFAPMYKSLSRVEDRRVILMQKNRPALPDYARRFVFDDFIHVVDTMRFISPGETKDARVSSFQKAGLLHHLLLHLEGDGFAATGVMNRDSGAGEETLEVMSPGNKWLVRGLDTTVHYREGEERITRFGDWDSVLERRGFAGIVDHFLHCARHDEAPVYSARDALDTHSLCEMIVSEAERNGAEAWGPPVF